MQQSLRVVTLLILGVLGIGCGKGLTVNLSADPDPADPGQSVTWTLSVRNDSECETTGEMVDLPDPLPDGFGAIAVFVGFQPEIDEADAREICQEFMTTLGACADQACLSAHLSEAFGPEVAAALTAHAMQAQSEPLPAGACITLFNDSNGVLAICAFDPLDPGETDTAMHTDTAPNTGNRDAAQVALAFAPAMGEDCRPGSEISEGVWTLAGCFPPGVTNPAPTMSPLVAGAGALLLVAGGYLRLRRRRS